jgi:hypothetical protein
MFRTNVVEKIKTHILCSITFFLKLCLSWHNIEKLSTAEKVTDDNMAHAHCMLDTQIYKHALGICNIYCFPTTIIIERKRLNLTSYVHCLSCTFLKFYWFSLSLSFHQYSIIILIWCCTCQIHKPAKSGYLQTIHCYNEFHCFTVHFNSLCVLAQLMHLFVIKH